MFFAIDKFFDDPVRHILGQKVCGRNWRILLKDWITALIEVDQLLAAR